MRLICTLKQSPVLLCALLLIVQHSSAQVCSDPAGTMYGMDNSGGIFPINTLTGVVGARINPAFPGNPALASNAIGYNPGNGRFYFFKRNADQTPQEFVSFNPSTNLYAILASCPSTLNIRTGCVSPKGDGYYCIDASANLYFYRFSSNQWKFITNTFIDQFGNNVTAILAARSSGDIAMDGWGDLYFLCSSTTEYGLYYLRGSLPVAAVASLSIVQKIAPTTPTPTGNNFAGIGFSPTGQIFLSQSGSNRLYRLNNNLALTMVGTFTTANVGGDMTSCVMPFAALAINQIDLSVQSKGDQEIRISWSSPNQDVKGYFIEYSNDAENWKTLAFVESNQAQTDFSKYTYSNFMTTNGRHYYRIRQVGYDGQILYSTVKYVDVKMNDLVGIGPNPTTGHLQVNNTLNLFSKIVVLDVAGHVLQQSNLKRGTNTFNVSSYPTGTYMVRLVSDNGQTVHQKIIKE